MCHAYGESGVTLQAGQLNWLIPASIRRSGGSHCVFFDPIRSMEANVGNVFFLVHMMDRSMEELRSQSMTR